MDSRFAKPREQWKWIQEIPNSVIAYNSSNGDGPSSLEFETMLSIPEQEGQYTIQLIGDTAWATYLIVDLTAKSGGAVVQEPSFDLQMIPIEKDSAVSFVFTYHGAMGAPVSLLKSVSAGSLWRDVKAMINLGWIKNGYTADKYLELVTLYGKKLTQANFAGARGALNSMIERTRADSSTVLTSQAYNLLRADVAQLQQRLLSH